MSDLFGDVVLSVSDLTKLLKSTLEGSFYGLTLEGEISNFRPASSGHWYFQLNDADAAIAAVMFKQKSWRIPFVPKDGDIVTVTGGLSLYEKRGTYQILCETMVRAGKGDILALLEERKRAFAEAGFFDASLKRTLPRYPKRVGVVTSPTGAALQDILQVLGRRNSGIDIVILPAPVQGDGAAEIIAGQIHAANRLNLADVLIIGRGGGSLEDLLPFSEQCVIEAIVASRIPIISAVGHEIDWALSDYAADLRAPTPSAAAELVSESRLEQLEKVTGLKQAMAGAVAQKIALTRSHTRQFTPRIMAEYFHRRLEASHLRLDDLYTQMQNKMELKLSQNRHTAEMLTRELRNLSPLAILDRGYAIVTNRQTGKIVTEAHLTNAGDRLGIRLAKGSLEVAVQSVSPPEEHTT
jgi:exodeoxyribonuclease VII large subunit